MQQVKKVRKGKDIRVRWRITINGAPADLSLMDLKVEIRDRFFRKYPLSHVVEGSEIVTTWEGRMQQHTGEHTLTLWVNWGKSGQAVVDRCKFVELVPLTCQESDLAIEGATIEQISLSDNITLGVQGKSAFESWLEQGNQGTEADFVAWIRQPAEDVKSEVAALTQRLTDLGNELSDNPPRIGDNGNWHIWDVNRDMYVDTGKPSTGDVLYPIFSIDPTTMELWMDCPTSASEGIITMEDGELIFNV